MINQWIQVRFEKVVTLSKKFDIMNDDGNDVKRELAEAMKKQLQSIIDNTSPEDFMKHYCTFLSWKEEVYENDIVGERAYYKN